MIDLRDFLVQADHDGELSLDHFAEGCYRSVPFEADMWPTVQQLTEAAQRHMREAHRVVIEGEALPRPAPRSDPCHK